MSQPHYASPSDLVGTIIGHYQLLGELATGGMGTVYRAKHELIDRVAAVKLLRPEFSANPEMVERFFNEARAATAIHHPGIVEVLDFGFLESGHAYLVMEYLEGQTLAARLTDRGRLSEVEAAIIVRGIASALGAAHAKGIIHRDLKPDNVFLVPDPDMPTGERPKVLDFGIAKLADDGSKVNQTRTGTLMGTPAYMAPEQARAAGEIDPRADLYALGCMLYEMLTGTTPFVAAGAGELIALQLFGVPEALRTRMPDCSIEMDHLVMRLLEKDPNARPQTAAEVMEALARAIPSLTSVVAAVSPGTQMRPAVSASSTSPAISVPRNNTPMPMGFADQGMAPRPSNKMGLVAGLATVTLVAGVAAVLLLRRGHEAKPNTATAGSGSALIEPTMTGSGSAANIGPSTWAPSVATVAVMFEIEPKNAVVELDGTVIARDVSGFVRFSQSSKPQTLSLTAPGYQPLEGLITLDRDQAVNLTMDKVGKPKRASLTVVATGKPQLPGANVPGKVPVDVPVKVPVNAGSGSSVSGQPAVDNPTDKPGDAGIGDGPATAPEGASDKPSGDSGSAKQLPGPEAGGVHVETTLDDG